MTFDPGAVPPADDPLADPGEADLRKRLDEARSLLDALRPATGENADRFLARDAVEAAVLMREHERSYFWRLRRELAPFSILRDWDIELKKASETMAESKVAEKTQLIAIALELLELWHDGAEAWCWPKEHGPGCCWRMPSGEVKRYLLAAYGDRHQADIGGGKAPLAPGRQAVAEALDQLEATAHAGPRRPEPALRVAGDGARLVVDLCRDDFAVAVVENGGWRVVKPSPLALRRAPGMLPLPLPEQAAGPSLDDLRGLLNFDGADHDSVWALFVGFMFAALRPTLPYFVLCIGGEQGTGKSLTAKVLRAPVDPHDTSIQPKPRSEDDLFASCDSQWLTAYDNLSTIDQHWSDAFCRISTGTGYSKRRLYTDRDTVRFRVARPQIITAIDDVVAAPDLLDRSLLVHQPELDGDAADELELLAEVEALTPRVLGQLLDAAAAALARQRSVKLHTVPRMVGPTKWVEAASEVLGLAPGQFLDAYLDSQARAGELALESSLVGGPLVDMLQGRDALAAQAEKAGKYHAGPGGFEGTAKELLRDLNEFMQGRPSPGPGWPRTPKGMGNALRKIAPALRKLGYVVAFLKVGHERTRIIVIDTPLSYARRSAHNANHSPHGPHSPQPHNSQPRKTQLLADGADCADGDSHTQRNGGDMQAGEAALRARARDLLAVPGWDNERLAQHVLKAAPPNKVTPAKLAEFVGGRAGSYHLRNALETALDDLEPYLLME